MAAAAGRGAGLGGEVEEDDEEEKAGRHRVTQHVHRDVSLQHRAVRLGDRAVHCGYYYVLPLFLVPQIDPSVPQPVFTITEKAPTRAFSWLKAATTAFTFKTLLRHYANQTARPL